jgi:hypothetical protein
MRKPRWAALQSAAAECGLRGLPFGGSSPTPVMSHPRDLRVGVLCARERPAVDARSRRPATARRGPSRVPGQLRGVRIAARLQGAAARGHHGGPRAREAPDGRQRAYRGPNAAAGRGTTVADAAGCERPDLVGRDFTASRPTTRREWTSRTKLKKPTPSPSQLFRSRPPRSRPTSHRSSYFLPPDQKRVQKSPWIPGRLIARLTMA